MAFYWRSNHVFSIFSFVTLATLISLHGVRGFMFVDENTSEELISSTTKAYDEVVPRSVGSKRLQFRSTFGSTDCNCTSLFQCDLGGNSNESNNDENDMGLDENGADLDVIDIRFGHSSNAAAASSTGLACSHYLEICCNHYQRSSRPKPTGPPPKRPRPIVPIRERYQQCGRRNVHGVGFRIVGGIEGEAQLGEFTWMIAVTELNKQRQGTVYLCGGSLIHPKIIMTAAHCVENKSTENLRIRAGEWDTQTEREDPYIHYDRHVNQVIIHEDYMKRPVLKNDIALVVLSKDVPLARHIGTVCLSSDLQPPPGSRCIASGWGKNIYGKEGNYQSILKKIDLPVVSRLECQEKYRETRLGSKFRLHPSFVCAGGERGKDTCKGDGGSPLVCQIPGSDRYAQFGIVSWGLNCGDPIPGAYSNVPNFVPWIEKKFQQFGLDSTSFKVGG